MNKVTLHHPLLIGFIALIMIGCNPVKKAMKQMENIKTPDADYSYAVEPEFQSSKEELESKIKGLYKEEAVKLSVAAYHRYDEKTREQTNEDYWIQCIINNSHAININDEDELFVDGRMIAQMVMEALTNYESYDKIQITFMKQWNGEGEVNQLVHEEFYKYPSFEKTTKFER